MEWHTGDYRMTPRCSRYWVSLALLSVVLPLMTSSLSSSQKQNPGNYRSSEAAFVATPERGENSKNTSSPKADMGFATPSLKAILSRMSQAAIRNETRLSPYTVTREYKLFAQGRDNARSRVIVYITVLPPDSRNYSVQRAEGSAIGEMIVRRVLKREAIIQKDGQSTDISQENYSFRFLTEEVASDQHCYVLQMLPRRKDKNLLRGAIWVDATTYLIHRVEGEPEENPSWWVRDVHIVLNYADVGGMWLPTSSEYTAKVRLLGQSAMVGHDLGYSYPQFAKSRNGLFERPPVLQGISDSFSSESKEVH